MKFWALHNGNLHYRGNTSEIETDLFALLLSGKHCGLEILVRTTNLVHTRIMVMMRLEIKSLRFHKANINALGIQTFLSKTVRFSSRNHWVLNLSLSSYSNLQDIPTSHHLVWGY